MKLPCILLLLALPAICQASPEKLTTAQRTELAVFGLRSLGMANATAATVKNVPTGPEVAQMVSAAINLQRYLCADVTDISPLAKEGRYEVSCTKYRGGKAPVHYVIDTRTNMVAEH
jgi:hypothetical protein